MKKKTILITGSSTGLGLAFARKFLLEGWKVIAHYYEETEEFTELLRNAPQNSIYDIYSDFSDDESVNLLLDHIATIDNLHALLNVAGCYDSSKDQDNRLEAARTIFQINTIVPTLIAEIVLDKLCKKQRGHIINVSSIGVKFGSQLEHIFYGSSKIAIEAVTRSLARKGAPYNVLVNTLRPGMTDTGFHIGKTEDMKARAEMIPLKRFAQPDEISEVVFFLCSQNTFITNQVIAVSGGE